MSTTGVPHFCLETCVTDNPQRDLFGEVETPALPTSGVFADVVFDRPLDHAYTYLVPEHLWGTIAAGKRVLVPFGKGDKSTIGYCIRVSDAPPPRAVKARRVRVG